MGTYRSSHPMMSDANRTTSIPRFAWFNPSSILSNPRTGYNNPLPATHINADVELSAIPLQSVPFSPPNELPNDDHEVTVEHTKAKKPKTSKKAASLAPKPKQTKKEPKKSSKKTTTTTTSSAKLERKDLNFATYEGNVDLSGVPTPFCSCTGVARQCYRWGSGGWQSSCCTTNVSEYPLPMSVTRPGSRMAGRKMSSGAYEKLLQRLAGDGCDLSQPVDLKLHWARHGTNKFVTIK